MSTTTTTHEVFLPSAIRIPDGQGGTTLVPKGRSAVPAHVFSHPTIRHLHQPEKLNEPASPAAETAQDDAAAVAMWRQRALTAEAELAKYQAAHGQMAPAVNPSGTSPAAALSASQVTKPAEPVSGNPETDDAKGEQAAAAKKK